MAASRVGAAVGKLEECGGGPACNGASRSPWADRRMWHVGKEKDGDDMWGPHASE